MKAEVKFLIKGNSNTQVEVIDNVSQLQAVQIIEMKYGKENITILGYRSL